MQLLHVRQDGNVYFGEDLLIEAIEGSVLRCHSDPGEQARYGFGFMQQERYWLISVFDRTQSQQTSPIGEIVLENGVMECVMTLGGTVDWCGSWQLLRVAPNH